MTTPALCMVRTLSGSLVPATLVTPGRFESRVRTDPVSFSVLMEAKIPKDSGEKFVMVPNDTIVFNSGK